MNDDLPKDFKELVQWATWEVIKGITSGQPLQTTLWQVCDYVRRWQPADATQRPGGGK